MLQSESEEEPNDMIPRAGRPSLKPSKTSATSLSSMRSDTSGGDGRRDSANTRKQSQVSRGYLEQVRQQLDEQGRSTSGEAPTLRRTKTKSKLNLTVVTIPEEDETEDSAHASSAKQTRFLSQMKRAGQV